MTKVGSKKILIVSLIILLVALLVLRQIKSYKSNDSLRKMGRLVNDATIISVNKRAGRASTLDVKYSYKIQTQTCESESEIDGIYFQDFKKEFITKSFPVIYLPDRPNRSEILITPDRFVRFGVDFPDSLKWVRDFWKKDYKRFD